MNINTTICNIFICFPSYYSIMGEIMNLLSFPLFLLILYFIFSFIIWDQIYVFNKVPHNKVISKRCTFLYLFISYLTNLVPLIDYEKKETKWISKGFNNPQNIIINIFIYLYFFSTKFGPYKTRGRGSRWGNKEEQLCQSGSLRSARRDVSLTLALKSDLALACISSHSKQCGWVDGYKIMDLHLMGNEIGRASCRERVSSPV